MLINHHALSAICPSFATFKPFGLLLNKHQSLIGRLDLVSAGGTDVSSLLQGVPKKIGLLSGFEFLTLGEVFLEVTFHQKTFLFYEIFWVSIQNFEKMGHICF